MTAKQDKVLALLHGGKPRSLWQLAYAAKTSEAGAARIIGSLQKQGWSITELTRSYLRVFIMNARYVAEADIHGGEQ